MDKTLIVARKTDNGIETIGRMMFEDFNCDSLELPWKDNQHKISCIPTSQYNCSKVGATSHIPYEHISIEGVQGRDGICIHRANYVSDLLGCIGVGNELADMNGDGQLDVEGSKNTFDKLMAILPNEFTLIIK